MDTGTYTSRSSGKRYGLSPDRGDGYWCPTHDLKCRRSCPERRWGRFGAAGVLFYHRASGRFLLNERGRVHHGGTWSTLGGAINRDEKPLVGAVREAMEELGRTPTTAIQVLATHEAVISGSAGSWTYTTFVVEVEDLFEAKVGDWESKSNAWVTISEMSTLALHPGLKRSIHTLLRSMVDAGAFRQEG